MYTGAAAATQIDNMPLDRTLWRRLRQIMVFSLFLVSPVREIQYSMLLRNRVFRVLGWSRSPFGGGRRGGMSRSIPRGGSSGLAAPALHERNGSSLPKSCKSYIRLVHVLHATQATQEEHYPAYVGYLGVPRVAAMRRRPRQKEKKKHLLAGSEIS
ncbi:uncharacterized protein LY79DRAFT_279486 [Colletotrichum navitas]|uniref:Uncharacterized protein n=1 Tax=Colletotrichum navitas TaxID=681940 RepID=A0AAD8PVF9_9PEZI|nr:uncharacterized protein LY79DRAFT_279486 [Colletotrichum navitas]KAK1584923.1 hypothetical protein LY79DRAFT_279486 [Colletotrichum navitas]